ncbi:MULTISPECIES: V-type ATPase subunit subunit G family protein [Methanofollis]|jgi:V/A-type H+-transporting ATPase subunit G/H|uniref:V-type ATPase subunit subunit G family protein n=1 Tax=Methanofollis TaxID=81416 RepID=UPI00082CD813|nr:V-type ATPase subunit subunit G family protein [Methanofollis ethanolicus]
MKSEVLKSIKQAEEEYTSMVSTARLEQKQKLADARAEAEHIVEKAAADAEAYKKSRLADAGTTAARKRAEILKNGEQRAAKLKADSLANLDKAVELLVSRFKEQLHVSA